MIGQFPFGEPVTQVAQSDQRPKKVFVLGVYASAVHALWRGPDSRVRVRALAVASEPCIFWRGEGAREIIEAIEVPAAAGSLEPTDQRFNGPSGRALDDHFLQPLGLDRGDAWLADLLPHSCANEGQRAAIAREYSPLVEALGLPPAQVPPVPRQLASVARQDALFNEIQASSAQLLVLLGDSPIQHFVQRWNPGVARLGGFGQDPSTYGRVHPLRIGDRVMDVLPLVHPRQAARLGRSSAGWHAVHQRWVQETAPRIAASLA